MTRKRTIFVLCIDGGTFNLIKPWIKEGKLPTFKKLIDKGVHGCLESTIPSLSCPAVPTFYTGKNMGKTGISSFFKDDGSLFSFKDVKDKTFWEIMNDYGVTTCIFNVPITYPPRELKGILISDPGIRPSQEAAFTYPPSLKEEFDFPLDMDWEKLYKNSSRRDFMLKLKGVTERRFQILEELIKRENYALVLFWIEISDVLQHKLWKSPKLILEYYEMIDEKLDGILHNYKFDNLVIFSDHGFEAYSQHNFFVNAWLEKEGYLKIKGGHLGGKVLTKIYPQIKKVIPQRMAYNIKRVLREKKTSHGDNPKQIIPGVDWKRTVACSRRWGIDIIKENLEGKDYESLREEIIDKLKKLKWRGLPLIREVKRRELEYHGPYLDSLPDILFVSGKGFVATTYPNSKIVGEDINAKKNGCEGEHAAAREGIFIAEGTDIAQGREIRGARIIDLAPTLLHLMNVPIPKDMDGRVLREIFKENSELKQRETKYKKIKEKERIKERIKKLKGKLSFNTNNPSVEHH